METPEPSAATTRGYDREEVYELFHDGSLPDWKFIALLDVADAARALRDGGTMDTWEPRKQALARALDHLDEVRDEDA